MLRIITVLTVILYLIISCTAHQQPPLTEQASIEPAQAVALKKEKGAIFVDTMSYLECMDHRIPDSLCIAFEEFEEKSKAILKNKGQHIIFYCESDECLRAGQTYQKAKILGYKNIFILNGGLPAWKKAGYEVESIHRIKRAPVVSIKPHMLERLIKEKKDLFILDARSEDLYRSGHIDGAVNIPLYELSKRLKDIPKNRPVLVIDENGKKSFLVCCWLINNGVKDVIRFYGGMKYKEAKERKKG